MYEFSLQKKKDSKIRTKSVFHNLLLSYYKKEKFGQISRERKFACTKTHRTKINSLAASLVSENVNNSKLWNFVFQKHEHLNQEFGL